MVLGTIVYIALKRRYLGSIGDVPAGREHVGHDAAVGEPLSNHLAIALDPIDAESAGS